LSLLFAIAQIPASQAATQKPLAIGGQKDAHGCLTGAGYQYSKLRHKCLRIFEDSIRLDPVAAALPQQFAAYIVFKAKPATGDAELFMPAKSGPTRMAVVKTAEGPQWKAKGLALKFKNRLYQLEDAKGQLLYQSPAAK
jgi:hypothetical protein